jgi:hypothetical protein
MRAASLLMALLLVVSCDKSKHNGSRPPTPQASIVNVALLNATTNELNWVELAWQGPDVPGGILPPGTSATALSVPWPTTTNATLSFIDYKSKKPYKMEIPLSAANEKVSAGGVQTVTFRILSYEKADVLCE